MKYPRGRQTKERYLSAVHMLIVGKPLLSLVENDAFACRDLPGGVSFRIPLPSKGVAFPCSLASYVSEFTPRNPPRRALFGASNGSPLHAVIAYGPCFLVPAHPFSGAVTKRPFLQLVTATSVMSSWLFFLSSPRVSPEWVESVYCWWNSDVGTHPLSSEVNGCFFNTCVIHAVLTLNLGRERYISLAWNLRQKHFSKTAGKAAIVTVIYPFALYS